MAVIKTFKLLFASDGLPVKSCRGNQVVRGWFGFWFFLIQNER